ncbi:MAG: ATP-binding cassette domain-containing protein [Bacteroidetes bacterium]|uniref:ATP-binding cassette domain-containing protein n=1 Tax=Phaeocystidibacter marisrubri TaxID=1577780 RepID=A0A6L3ZG90_9FLAO|nr:ATP-binding cassette domain-containing protein [Phaeocystidibacter marisrubri]KAB2815959.1 ATP-binding cassette domain-containing protein [Phaeocystidibacter marisrubri]TNE31338.1 MAG: ATP-binding cassette domain-containing protein [Bacteroidota bacterium]GGH66593.1 hypothetical protein GCM10011318_04730 [Phaeocystidibacter marisrubri]
MQVKLEDIGKKYDRHFVFRGVSVDLFPDTRVAILGGNGSGKSTLLKVISGSLTATTGKLSIIDDSGASIPVMDYMRKVAFTGPYTEVIEEFNLREIVDFQSKFRPWRNNLSNEDVVELTGLKKVSERSIANFSSGMRQRVRLALAILADTPILLLDEPTSNLDAKAMKWFHELLEQHIENRILCVGSNHQSAEIALCTSEINLTK